ncbi:MAG: ketoacyl-ACP synthase III [Flavobacteriales bacterium]|nr:ketoacyl-ACP synthase III [Flavobacteriales bacterium]
MDNVRIVSIGAAVPQKKLLSSQVSFESDETRSQFIRQVGVTEKRYSQNRLTAGDLCFSAAQKLLTEVAWDPSTIGVVILVTQSPDRLMPATAILLQEKLGLPSSCLAFDINLGCSGWVYGLSVVSSLMQTLKIDRGLLLAGETAVLASEDDTSYFPLMGDAGTATVLELSMHSEPMVFQFYSDGSQFEAIHAPNSGARHFADGGTEAAQKYRAQMDADQVLRFCLRDVVPNIHSFLNQLNVTVQEIDYFVFHQANKLINEAMRKKLNIPEEKFPYSIGQFGNTSSASIPLTMVTQLREQMAHKQTLLCSGFGVGLSMGHVLLHTENIICHPIIEVAIPEK